VTLEQFEEAVHQHRDRVFGFALHFLGDREEAEDVTQDVLIRLWSNRDTVVSETLSAWILRVTRNACVDQYRKRRTKNLHTDNSLDGPDQIAATSELPDTTMDNQLLRDHIMKSVEELREPYKSIVILRELQDLSYEEIGSALDLPLTTVKVYLHRGRKALRSSLSDFYAEMTGQFQQSSSHPAV